MEDFAVTIFRIVIIAFLIIGVVKRDKRKRMSGKGSGSGSGSGSFGKPFEQQQSLPVPVPVEKRTVLPTPAPNHKSSQATGQSRQQPLHKSAAPAQQRVAYVEVDPDEAEAMATEYYKTRNAYSPLVTAEKPSIERKHADDKKDESDDIADRFNIRDAVLYSEILRPKFD